MGKFWTQSCINERFRRSVFMAVVRSSLVTGLDSAVLTNAQINMLEAQQCKYTRKILCGKGCLKLHRTRPDGEDIVEYRALPNESIRLLLHIPTIQSELLVRRLCWLQTLVKYPDDAKTVLSALQGFALWGQSPTIFDSGDVSPSANPWTKQFFVDLEWLSRHSTAAFALKWQELKWWSIYTSEFSSLRIKSLKSTRIIHDRIFEFTTSDVLCPNVIRCSFMTEKTQSCATNFWFSTTYGYPRRLDGVTI